MLVGRLVQDPEVKELESGKKVSNITLAINRNFKNVDGVYETDFVDCVIWDGIANNVGEYCKKGDVIGVRGRLQTSLYEDKEGKTMKNLDVVAEKISFLTSKHREQEQEI
jgi:single-strand DNA-binding protein